jgi:glycosyltransferase involved in cell wall biosynthesis
LPAAQAPRRVLLTTDTVGGVWTYAVELGRSLARRGVEVHLATMGAPMQPHQRLQVTGCRGLTVHEGSWRLEWMQDPWDDVDLAGAWLLGLERQVEPDLVHLNQFAFGDVPFRVPKLVVAHSCVVSWWQEVLGGDPPAGWAEYRRRVGNGLAGADLVAAPTRWMLESLARNYGCSTPALVLPNGRSAAMVRPSPKQAFVFSAGRLWDEGKNLAALDEAAVGLPWPVRVAGSCAHPDGRVTRPKAVDALGELPPHKVLQQMACAGIYALPARYEPFGLSVLEAALSGCALVLGDIASLRETWGPAAVYVPPGDPAALRQALLALIERPADRERLAAAAMRRASHFTTDTMTAAYLQAYARLAPAFRSLPEEVPQCA